jgi:hypothetical protein
MVMDQQTTRPARPLVLSALLVALAVALATACAREAGEEPMVASYEAPAEYVASAPARTEASLADSGGGAAAPAVTPGEAPPPVVRRLVKTVQVELTLDDTEAGAARLGEVAGQLGGYVSQVQAQRRDELLYYHLTLRVPVERLEEALAAVRALAVRVDRESLSTEDVTERYVDLEARLATLPATAPALPQRPAVSRARARDVEQIMAVYRQLTEIRTQIEQIEGQRRALAQLAALSTLEVDLRPTEAARPLAPGEWRPGETVRTRTRVLVAALQGLADLAITFVIVGLPLILLVALPIWALVRLVRWSRRRGSAG